jgi:DNA-binding transcriptional regulator YbjK
MRDGEARTHARAIDNGRRIRLLNAGTEVAKGLETVSHRNIQDKKDKKMKTTTGKLDCV